MSHKKTKNEKIVLMLTRNKIFLPILGHNSCALKIPFAYRTFLRSIFTCFPGLMTPQRLS